MCGAGSRRECVIVGGHVRLDTSRLTSAFGVGMLLSAVAFVPVTTGSSAQAATDWNCGVRPMNGPTFVKAKGVSCETAWDFVQRASGKWQASGFRRNTFGYRCEATADAYGNFRATCRQGTLLIKGGVAA